MERELDLREIWQVLVKQWKLIVSLPLLAALAGAFVSFCLITPQYQASTTLLIMKQPESAQILYQDIQVGRQLVHTYREIAHSRRVLESVVASLGLPYTVGQLRGMIEVTAVRDTEIIAIDVTHPDPRQAAAIANEVARSFMQQVVQIMSVENINLIDRAIAPESPVSPRVRLNVAAALVIGLMAAVGLAFLLEYLDRTIKSLDEVQQYLNLPVLGIIPHLEDS